MHTLTKIVVTKVRTFGHATELPEEGEVFYLNGRCPECASDEKGNHAFTGIVTEVQESGDFVYFADQKDEYVLEAP